MVRRTLLLAALASGLSVSTAAFAQDEGETAEDGDGTDATTGDTTPPADEREMTTEEEERAKDLFTNGRILYKEGRYEEAIVAFLEAYKLSQRKGLLLNIASAEERLGRLQDALNTLNAYRVYAKPNERQTIERRIRNLEARLGESGPGETGSLTGETTITGGGTNSGTSTPLTPVGTTPNPRGGNGGARWAVFGVGLAVAAGCGTATGFTYAMGIERVKDNDRKGYESTRAMNQIFGVLTGVGVIVSGIGLVVGIVNPASKSGTNISPYASKDGFGATIGSRF